MGVRSIFADYSIGTTHRLVSFIPLTAQDVVPARGDLVSSFWPGLESILADPTISSLRHYALQHMNRELPDIFLSLFLSPDSASDSRAAAIPFAKLTLKNIKPKALNVSCILPDDGMTLQNPVVYVFQAEGGASALLRFGPFAILIDGGRKRVPACFGHSKCISEDYLNYVVLTHSDNDHSSGLLTLYLYWALIKEKNAYAFFLASHTH